jgi:YD repeat-containing protein
MPWTYGYDGSSRLTSAVEQGVFNHSYVYTYDNAGNRTSEQIDGVTSTESANSVNQLTNQSSSGTTITYDLAGNELTKVGAGGALVFEWDGANRCTAIATTDGQISLAYDGLNRWTHITQATQPPASGYLIKIMSHDPHAKILHWLSHQVFQSRAEPYVHSRS